MKYRNTNLAKEEAFDDIEYADYEICDYSSEEEMEEESYNNGGRKRKNIGLEKHLDSSNNAVNFDDPDDMDDVEDGSVPDMQLDQEVSYDGRLDKRQEQLDNSELDLYKRYIEIEDGEAAKARYGRLAALAKNGTEEEKKAAKEEACLYMKGFVRKIIKDKFSTYIERDCFYAEELEQEAFINIMKYLDRYDPEKGRPSTFFYHHIKSAMVSHTNRMKHAVSSSDAALKRKINRINKQYAELGRKAQAADYAIETGETLSKIRSVLHMMSLDTNTHLEAIEEYDQLIAGDPIQNPIFDTPENIVIKKIMVEGIMKRMREKFSDEEIEIFFRGKIYMEPIPSIAKDLGGRGGDDKVRRTIEKIRNSICYDPEIRKLCSSYIRTDPVDLAIISIVPLEGENKNMDLLETCIL